MKYVEEMKLDKSYYFGKKWIDKKVTDWLSPKNCM